MTKYNIDDVPEIRNGSNRPAPRLLKEIVPQQEGLHFVTGDYDQDHHGETVILFDGDKKIQGAFIQLPNRSSQADSAINRKSAVMQQ